MTGPEPSRVWYVAYGSNLASERFRFYLRGGPVPGGSRVYPGCRDPREPAEMVALRLPGRLVFSGRSLVWGGGIAFHDRAAAGRIAARGYRITTAQLADVVAQETREPPGGPVALRIEAQVHAADGVARTWDAAGLYDTLTFLGHRDGLPLVTITHGEVASMTPASPSTAYLHWIVVGLREAHGWDGDRIDRYLARMPGVEPRGGDAARVLH